MAYASSVKLLVSASPLRTGFTKKHLKQKQRVIVTVSSVNRSVRSTVPKTLKVAYQGVPGAYSEFAAKTASPECTPIPCRAIGDAIKAVETGQADLAVVPVESTLEGTALRNYDLLLQSNLPIVQEINLFVHYCLLAMPGVSKGELKRVISHPMALAHCGRALAQLGLDHEPVEDTAGAVELLRSNQMLDTAAIGSSRAGLIYGLDVLAHGVQDESWNVTRFLILAKNRLNVPNRDRFRNGIKTSMVVAHHSGSLDVLLKVLSSFSKRKISLTKLEVKNNEPSVSILDVEHRSGSLKEFPNVLYVDFEGSIDDRKVKDALCEIKELPVFVRVLGSYSADPSIYGLH